MLYYLGKEGNAFKKEECKEYKTKDGALKAMAKAEGTCVWDAEGNLINGKLEAETEPEAGTEPEAEPEPEQQSEQEAEPEPEQQTETEPEQQSEPEAEAESEAEPEESTEPKVIIPQGKMKCPPALLRIFLRSQDQAPDASGHAGWHLRCKIPDLHR